MINNLADALFAIINITPENLLQYYHGPYLKGQSWRFYKRGRNKGDGFDCLILRYEPYSRKFRLNSKPVNGRGYDVSFHAGRLIDFMRSLLTPEDIALCVTASMNVANGTWATGGFVNSGVSPATAYLPFRK